VPRPGETDTAFGATLAQRNLLRYAGYAYDDYSGMYYLQRRYYDTVTRSFISRDPGRADGLESPYQYCGGRPVSMVDPTGLFAHGGQTRNCGALRGMVQPWDPSPYHTAMSWDPASAVYNNPTFQAGLGLLGESLTYGPPGTPTFAAHRWLQANHPTANAYVDVGANLAWCFVPGLGEVEAPYRGWKVYRAGRAGLEAYEAEKDIRAGIGAYRAARAADAGLDLVRTADAANDAAAVSRCMHGNSAASTRAQHLYEIWRTNNVTKDAELYKYGVSGSKITLAGESYRAGAQTRYLNSLDDGWTYTSEIRWQIPAGPGARRAILDLEWSAVYGYEDMMGGFKPTGNRLP